MNLWFFEPELLEKIEINRDSHGVYRVRSHPTDKLRRAKTEEVIKQLVVLQLRHHYHYPHEMLLQEYTVQMGILKKRADIAIVTNQKIVETIIEVKQVVDEDSILQLKSYMSAVGAKYGAVISPFERFVFYRDDARIFHQISDLPIFERQADVKLGGGDIAEQKPKIEDSNGRILMATLGITGLKRIGITKSELIIKNNNIEISNIDLSNYNQIRKTALGQGIVLPSSVKKSHWDEAVSLLFENSSIVEGNRETVIKENKLAVTDDESPDQLAKNLGITGLTRIDNTTRSILHINGNELRLSNTELNKYSSVKKLAIDFGIVLPSHMKSTNWDTVLAFLFKNATTIGASKGASEEERLLGHLEQYCGVSAPAQVREDMLKGKLWTNNGRHYFRGDDLLQYLSQHGLSDITPRRMWSLLRHKVNAKHEQFQIKGRCVQAWSIPEFTKQTETLEPPIEKME